MVLLGKMVVFGQHWFYLGKMVAFGQHWSLFGPNGCIWAKLVLFGQIWFYLVKIGSIWVKFLNVFFIDTRVSG